MESEISIDITDHNDSQRVFTVIKQMATKLGMGLVRQTQLITAASELLTNIVKYAGKGEVTVSIGDLHGPKKIIVKAIDKGPGITNLALAMKIGYSTNKTLGIGLPGAKQLSDEFNIETKPGHGTTITIAKWV